MDNTRIRRVHVVYKTHLDMGFTALASEVLEKYRTEFIPRALDTAEEVNQNGARNFIWTVGSWLIEDYLTHMPEAEAARMDAAIRRGDIAWHALAFTTHSELMDDALLRYNLSISERLCARYGKQICAAKQSDVPGHTIAMLPAFADAGVKYLHIGINGSSRPVVCAPIFRWQYGGREILVDYSAYYGAVSAVEGCDEVMEFAHTKDNMGPPDAESVCETIAELQKKYPNAVVEASTMDAFYQAIAPFRDRLPVVTEEMGDTWIHGVGTDPHKVAAFRRLLEKRRSWIENGALEADSAADRAFLDALLLVTEHTWGMDIKKYLYDFKNWERTDFEAARERDKTGAEELAAAGDFLAASVRKEHEKYTNGEYRGSYSLFERSHAEQRAYLRQAVDALPEALRAEAQTVLEVPAFAAFSPAPLQRDFRIGGREIAVETDGSLLANGRSLGVLRYEVFDWETVDRCYHTYNRAFDETRGWAEPDFSKPGLAAVADLQRAVWAPHLIGAEQTAPDTLRVVCGMDGAAVERFGCPRQFEMLWRFDEQITVELRWRDKAASRIPEAIWYGFDLPTAETHRLGLRKIGQHIAPFAVMPGGARKLHACEAVLIDGQPVIENHDAPLVCMGERALYDVTDDYPDPAGGAQFLLYNNRWGTNFKMWYGEDAFFRFTIRL
ncbi:MAG: DUF5054 domain-containing protein [Butyricicoccus sp.]|nr:DUF5054 domain-containing protein [Butyricicoccus sp.]